MKRMFSMALLMSALCPCALYSSFTNDRTKLCEDIRTGSKNISNALDVFYAQVDQLNKYTSNHIAVRLASNDIGAAGDSIKSANQRLLKIINSLQIIKSPSVEAIYASSSDTESDSDNE
jgi:hypothetical protein